MMNAGSAKAHRADSSLAAFRSASALFPLSGRCHNTFTLSSSVQATDMPFAEALILSRLQRSLNPRNKSLLRSLSDAKTLNELTLRLKEGIYITTFDGEIIDANPAFLEMIGVDSLQDLKGYHTPDF